MPRRLTGRQPRPAATQERLHFTEQPPPGLRFRERMTGRFVAGAHVGDELELLLTVEADDLERMLREPAHEAGLVGSAKWPALFDEPLIVTEGRFNLFVLDPERVECRAMLYRGTMTSQNGHTYRFFGCKEIVNRPGFDLWSAVTTLYLSLEESGRGLIGHAVLKISASDVLRGLRTLRPIHADRFVDRLDALVEFGRFFGGTLLDTYGRLFAPARRYTLDAPRRPVRRRRWLDKLVAYDVPTDDGITLRLVHCRGGERGPVILSPGFGMSSRCFWLDTNETSLTEYLAEAGYDVWCLDYRASPDVLGATTSYTIDDIARRDYPAAVQKVLDRTGAGQVQMVVHCVGSLSFLMSALDGQLKEKIHSAVCSQLGLHPRAPFLTEAKSGLYLARALRLFGVRTVTADYDEHQWDDWALDKLLRLYPTRERCNNPVCRRIFFVFGESYRHDQLNTATHEAMHEMFGITSLRALQHLALMVRAGQAVDKDGEDVYLPNVKFKYLDFPIAFLHGAKNREFFPEATQKTFEWLRQHNGPARYAWERIPGYGHLDCFIGRNAHRVVFPRIRWYLEHPPPNDQRG